MTAIELANRYLQPYKRRGDEIIPKLCPFCKGGEHHKDTETFALNIAKGTYNCKRGKCGAVGTLRELHKYFGEPYEGDFEWRSRPPKTFRKPNSQVKSAKEKVAAYLRSRGISQETWERRKVGEVAGNIAFPYYENGELVLIKFRRPEPYTGKGPKAWREEGGKDVFWGMDDCDPALPLVIVEGEIDALTLDEAGVPNVVSVPNGALSLECVDNCWEWLENFGEIIIWPDNDEPGHGMAQKLIKRLGEWRCRIVQSPYKDANDHLLAEGKESVLDAVVSAKEVPVAGIVRLADVQVLDIESQERVLSFIKAINERVGGYMMGQLSVWSGTNGSGKSTLLGQELLYAIDQGYSVCAYSGELPSPLFRYWIDVQAAGPNHLHTYVDPKTGRQWKKPDPAVIDRIRSWYRDKFFLYEANGPFSLEDLFKVFTYAVRRYDCRVFLVDNLMTLMRGVSEHEYYRKQSDTVAKLVEFAHQYHVHVHLVAHPRKTLGRMTKMDVAGSGDITNLADNVFAIYRVTREEKQSGWACDAILDCFKARFTGMQDFEVLMGFDDDSKRFYQMSDGEKLYYKFGWERELAA